MLRRRLGQIVKPIAAAYDRINPPAPGLAMLIYHRVGAQTHMVVDLPRALFRSQIELLAERYQPLPLALAADHLERGQQPDGAPAVVVTFDDGTADFVEEALPILVAHAIPTTLFVATAFIEEGRPFPDGGRPVSWAALADAMSTGLVSIGSHTHTHALLHRASAPEATDELDRSIGLISDRLGVAPDDFAYPKALGGSREADAAVRARFRTAALAGTRRNRWSGADLHQLARTPVQATDGMRWFTHKANGGLRLEDAARAALNRIRQ